MFHSVMRMDALNAGIIGAGKRSMAHINTLLKLRDKFKITAVCDINGERAESAARMAEAKPYTNLLKMLSNERIDVCLIAIQAEGHHVIAKTLAERGVHFITETPLAITLACANQMIEAARDSGVLLEVSENVPRWLNERLKQRIVSSGLLGEVRGFYLSYVSGSYHGIAAIRSIIGAEAESVIGEHPPKDSVLERAEILLLNGVKGLYEFNREKGNYWEIIGTKGALRGSELYMYDGYRKFKIQIDISSGQQEKPRILGAKLDALPEIYVRNHLEEYPLDNVDEIAIADAWLSLYNAIKYGKPLTYGAENARRDLELLMAIRESALHGGVKINLPLKEITDYERIIHEEFAKIYGINPLLLEPKHLEIEYTLPGKLRSLMYCGRVDVEIKI